MELSAQLQPVLLELSTALRALAYGPTGKQLPEKEEFDKAEKKHTAALNAAASAQMAVDDVENEILRIQSDERKLRQRERDDMAQLAAETDPERRKDLEHDRYAAKSRIADLMSELQEAHNEIHALRNNVEVHGARVDEAARELETARRALEAAEEAAALETPREERVKQLREQLPDDVLAEFDQQRAVNGVGVAEFKGNKSCGGCFIVLPPAEQAAIRNAPADQLPQCSDCGSYLVRLS